MREKGEGKDASRRTLLAIKEGARRINEAERRRETGEKGMGLLRVGLLEVEEEEEVREENCFLRCSEDAASVACFAPISL